MAESSKGEYGKILTCSRGEYEKKLQAHEVKTRKYWLEEVIENGCIVTRVRVYNEILPEQYFIVYPSSRHNTVTILPYLYMRDYLKESPHICRRGLSGTIS